MGPWVASFSNLEYLLLAPRGNSLAVRSSLAGLTRLKDLVLSVKQHDLVDNMEVGRRLFFFFFLFFAFLDTTFMMPGRCCR